MVAGFLDDLGGFFDVGTRVVESVFADVEAARARW
jgi:hypothetical protein